MRSPPVSAPEPEVEPDLAVLGATLLGLGVVSRIVMPSLSATFDGAVFLPKSFNAMLRAPPCSWGRPDARPGSSFETRVEELRAGQQFRDVDLQPQLTLCIAQALCDPWPIFLAHVHFKVIRAAQTE